MGKKLKNVFFINNDGTISIDGENISKMAVPELLSAWSDILGGTKRDNRIHTIGTSLMQDILVRMAKVDMTMKEQNVILHKADMEQIDNQVLIKNQQDMIEELRKQCNVMILEKEDDNIVIDSLLTDKENIQDLIEYQRGHIDCLETKT